MGIEAISKRDDGSLREPIGTNWRDWVAATDTRNYVIGDPVLDWLTLFGAQQGFKQDSEHPGYDNRTDYGLFIREQGRRFEVAVVDLLSQKHQVTRISEKPGDARDIGMARATFSAMAAGMPLIHQGVLWDAEHQTYGVPDLLVRSDVLHSLFPSALTKADALTRAGDLAGSTWHYRVVDTKFTTLRLSAQGDLDNTGSAPAYKVQLHIYNRALARLQGFQPAHAYLLGRGWTQKEQRGTNCMDRLAPIPQTGSIAHGIPIAEVVKEATGWALRVRREGVTWKVLPTPTVPELYPDKGNQQDGPWHVAKRHILEELEDLTLLWQVSASRRRLGHEAGIFRWKDLRLTPEILGVKGEKQAPVLKAMLDLNRSKEGALVLPAQIETLRDQWHTPGAVEFYVDFETVSDLADDFSRMPERGGQTLIYMIGCGHLTTFGWIFKSFLVNALTEAEEARIIDEWLAHMTKVREKLAPEANPKVFHWSPAEEVTFETAYNSAKARQNREDWPKPNWFDFLNDVVRQEPVVVRDSFGFGLKPIAKAMHGHSLVETLWGDGPTDGLGAMVAAWWCQEAANSRGLTLPQIDLMQEVVSYNEVDCKVMMEIIAYLRREH